MATQRTKIVRAFPLLQVKAIDDAAGTFSGYLAVFGNEDLGGDVIQPGAFTKTLQDLKGKQQSRGSRYLLPIFWGHDPNNPIGGFTEAKEDKTGLFVVGELDLDIEPGQRAYSGLKKGYADGMSIGYFSMKPPTYKNGVRQLTELALIEGSLTPIPMNPEATVMDVKDQQGGSGAGQPALKASDFDTVFNTQRSSWDLMRELNGLTQAFQKSVISVLVDGDDTGVLATSLDQFGTKVTAWAAMAGEQECWADLASRMQQYGGDDPYDFMSREMEGMESKAGRMMSGANHDAMGKALDGLKDGINAVQAQHKALSDMHTQMAPKSDEPSADGQDTQDDKGGKSVQPGAGAGAAPDGALAGNTTPDDSSDEPLSDAVRSKLLVMQADMLARKYAKVGS